MTFYNQKYSYKSDHWHFLLRTAYNITINKTTRRDILWILDAKYENKDKIKSNVTIIVPCKSGKLNKTGRFLLVTDSTIDEKTLRLGDSDLLLQYHRKLDVLVKRKQRTCRQVSVVLIEIQKAVKRFIWKLIRPKWPITLTPSYCGDKWSFRLFSMSGSELLSMMFNQIPLSHLECDWEFWNLERDGEFGIKVCQSIILSDSKTFSCLSFNNRSCLYFKAANWMWTHILYSYDFAYLILISSNDFILILYLLFLLYWFIILIIFESEYEIFFGVKILSEFIV